ncbi:hypothetical protein ACEPAG_9413 [Sanghuangporus baumii]
MEWNKYEERVVDKHRVALIGWPKDVPFKTDLSIPNIETVLDAMRKETCRWKKLTDREYVKHCKNRKDRQKPIPPPSLTTTQKRYADSSSESEARKRARESHIDADTTNVNTLVASPASAVSALHNDGNEAHLSMLYDYVVQL